MKDWRLGTRWKLRPDYGWGDGAGWRDPRRSRNPIDPQEFDGTAAQIDDIVRVREVTDFGDLIIADDRGRAIQVHPDMLPLMATRLPDELATHQDTETNTDQTIHATKGE